MNGRTRWWFTLAVLLGAVPFIALACQGGPAQTGPAPAGPSQPSPGTPGLPYDFRFALYQGEEVVGKRQARFSEFFSGKPVLLNFFAGQCPPCRAELPHFREASQVYRDRVLFVGVDVGPFLGLGSFEDGRALLKEFGVTYPAGSPPDGAVLREYRVTGMPTTIFFTPEGKVFRQWTGILTKGKLESILGDLLKASGG